MIRLAWVNAVYVILLNVATQSVRALLRSRRIVWVAAGVSLTLFAVVLALGITFEGEPWVENRPFTTNLVSGFCAALFGLPFALLVVQYISRVQAEHLQRKSAEKLARWAAEQLVDSVRRLAEFTHNAALAPAVHAMEASGRAMEEWRLRWQSDLAPVISSATAAYTGAPGVGPDRATLIAASRTQLAEMAREARVVVGSARTRGHSLRVMIGDDDRRRYHAAEVGAAWAFTDEHVRPRLVEVEAEWIERELYGYLRTSMYPSVSSGAQLDSVVSMLDDAMRTLEQIAREPESVISSTTHNRLYMPLFLPSHFDQIGRAIAEIEAIQQLEVHAVQGADQLRNLAGPKARPHTRSPRPRRPAAAARR